MSTCTIIGRGFPLGAALLAGSLAVLAAPAAAQEPAGQQPGMPASQTEQAPGRRLAQMAATAPGGHWTTADHSRHEALKKPFASAEEVTAACLSCHTQAAEQMHKTIHWTWVCPKSSKDKPMGKNGLTLNNFCIAIPANEPRCTSCHVGFGWKDKNFDFGAQNKVDCIVCHEREHTYKKYPTGAGYPASEPTEFPENKKMYNPPDWNKLAQSVGRPDRVNCGTCHFNGGGGDAVKHGDLDSSLVSPDKALDVHMDAKGLNFSCSRCHTTKDHKIAGRCYTTPAGEERLALTQADLASKIFCESCHSATPHKAGSKANDHTDKVACQSCHIPEFARKKPTKMWWDWSKAGQMKDGKPYSLKGDHGESVYDSKKGEFRWEKNVVPEYRWYNGSMSYLLVTDTIDPSKPVALNHPVGDPKDPGSRIMPFKVHRGRQPYDVENKTFVFPHLFGPKGSTAYWAGFDWGKAIAAGMEYAGLPYSGKFDFVETEYSYQTTHMVAPKEKTLACDACHARPSRLDGVGGVYMPGRDRSTALDVAGWGISGLTFLAVVLHGVGRWLSRKS